MRSGSKSYMAIADHLTPDGYVAYTENGTKYQDLKEAYDAYSKLVTTGVYQDYMDTLPKKQNRDHFENHLIQWCMNWSELVRLPLPSLGLPQQPDQLLHRRKCLFSFQRNDGVAGSISWISDPEAADRLGIVEIFHILVEVECDPIALRGELTGRFKIFEEKDLSRFGVIISDGKVCVVPGGLIRLLQDKTFPVKLFEIDPRT